ncbi:MAG: sulfotransferase family 2 domain-containing protein [Gammaproteobacteria bacterium]|nr:sulfotransferase family 2 domain-containing protein [Gammaproteobacteria bacterium]
MICEEYKCIFVHIPKVAGQSVEHFFLNKLGLSWDTEKDQLYLINNKDPAKGTEKLAHLAASEYVSCGHISQQMFDDYYKFSFVRNPWARIVSEYRYRNYLRYKSFKDFVINKMPPPGFDDKYRHVMPQYDMLYDENGKCLVDFVGRFESLQQDFDKVCDHLSFEDSKLPYVNSSEKKSRILRRKIKNLIYRNGESDKKHYTEFYDNETIDAVSEYYKNDIETFKYTYGE